MYKLGGNSLKENFSENELLILGESLIKKIRNRGKSLVKSSEFFLQSGNMTKIIGGGQAKITGEHKNFAGVNISLLFEENKTGSLSTSLPIKDSKLDSFIDRTIDSCLKSTKNVNSELLKEKNTDISQNKTILYDKKIKNLTIDNLIDYTADLASVGFLDLNGRSLVAEISKYIESLAIVNSNGISKSSTFGWLYAQNFIEVNRSNGSSIGYAEGYSRSKTNFDVIKIGSNALSAAVLQYGRRKIANSDWNNLSQRPNIEIIWEPKAFADLMAFTLIRFLRSRNLLSQNNPLSNKNIAVPNITVINDPTISMGFGSRNFDDTGKNLVKQKLVGDNNLSFISDHTQNNLFRAANFEQKYRSYQYDPQIFPTNILIKPTSDIETTKTLIPSCSAGILIRKIVGVPGTSASGNFSIGLSEAYFIEKGQWRYPIARGNLTGNYYDLLMNIKAMGTKVEEIVPIFSPYAIHLPQILTVGGIETLEIDHS